MPWPTAPESFTIVKDISDRKQAEPARLQAVEPEAQNLVLLEADLLRDESLANMSHELRTPLNAVIGCSKILPMAKVGADSPRYANHIRLIGESGQRLLQLVQTMLAPERMAFGVDIMATVEGDLTLQAW